MKRLVQVSVWLALVTVIFRVGQSPSVIQAWLQFYTLGIIPGTDIQLSQGQTFVLLAVVLLVAVGAIFYSNLRRLLRRPVTAAVALQQPTRKAVVTIAPQPVSVPHTYVSRLTKPAALARPFLHNARNQLQVLMPLWQRLSITAGQMNSPIRGAVVSLLNHVQAVAAMAFAVAKQAWRWLRPHLHTFDRFLEKQLKAHDTSGMVIAICSEAGRLGREWLAVARAIANAPRKTSV